jgi:putative nucleotidyltransferase with HDIG domain
MAAAADTPGTSHRLPMALKELEGLPALAESRNRLLQALQAEQPSNGELIATIESDVALVVAILRIANRVESPHRGRVCTVRRAIEVLTPDGIETLVKRIAVVDFFEQIPGWEVTPDTLRRHSVATQRVADDLATEEDAEAREELSVAALLHDVGKLVLGVAYPGYREIVGGPCVAPEDRLCCERSTFGVDHAMVGGVLIRRWGLPKQLAATVAAHHDPEAEGAAALIRLADLLVHYGHGWAVNPRELARAGARVGLEGAQLRSFMYELPSGNGSRRRAAHPCPLTKGEIVALRGLAAGQSYKEIAFGLGRAASTIRSQVHSAYKKLAVRDRTQAVLLATDQGWL